MKGLTMKTIFASLAAALMVLLAQPAKSQAQGLHLPDNWYLEVAVAGMPLSDAFVREGNLFGVDADTQIDCDCVGIQATLGGYIASNVRAEYQFTYQKVDAIAIQIFGGVFPAAGDINVITNMFNVLYEFQLDPAFVPFVGGGFGFTIIDPDTVAAGTTVNDSDVAFTAAAIVGLDVPINELVTFTTRYTLAYISSTDHSTNAPGFDYALASSINHVVSAGLRVDLSELRNRLR